MQALQFQRSRGLNLVTLNEPEPKDNELLIEVACAGVCGTDLHILAGEAPAAGTVIPGHEFSGKVITSGKSLNQISPGTMVAVDPNNHCDACVYCHRGAIHLCQNIRPVGIYRDGGWAEYCVVPASQVYPLPENMDPVLAALAEPLSCIIHGWDRLAPVSHDRKILIMGAGIIGLLWALLLRHHGITDVQITEPRAERRKLANNLDHKCIAPEILESDFDIIIDCSGAPAAIEQAQAHLNVGGKLLLFGMAPEQARISLSPYLIFQKEWTILGSVINPFTFARALALLPVLGVTHGDLGISLFVLSDYKSAINAAQTGAAAKVMFEIKKNDLF